MEKRTTEWRTKLVPYTQRILWSFLFLFLAILFLTIGFWKTMLIASLVVVGFSIGYVRDHHMDLETVMEQIRLMIER
ncbi:MAG: DUF2273 domain-containing protein [Enterococcus sp.]